MGHGPKTLQRSSTKILKILGVFLDSWHGSIMLSHLVDVGRLSPLIQLNHPVADVDAEAVEAVHPSGSKQLLRLEVKIEGPDTGLAALRAPLTGRVGETTTVSLHADR